MGKPADLAVAEDGTLYLADIGTHHIYHIDTNGNVLDQWGAFSGEGQSQPAQPGTFNQPWGLTVAPDGTVYVADTWNHRIQAFSSVGDFVRSWGEPGQGDEPLQLFGPRDVAVNASGLVFVSDTGNKRIVVYNRDGDYIAQLGGGGEAPGQFNEPVGIAFSPGGDLYVADQGNRRVQVLSVAGDGTLTPKASWPVDAWEHNDALYKPYLCVMQDSVFLTDTETGLVQEYTTTGEYRATFNLNTTGYLNYGLLYGIAPAGDGSLWVSDLAGGAGVLVRIIPGS